MKKITKIISFCAAITMAATAVPASSLMMAKAADELEFSVNHGEIIEAHPGDAIEIPLYMQATGDTEGITIAFRTTGTGAATKSLLNAVIENPDKYPEYSAGNTYQGCDQSKPFFDVGKWSESPKALSWGVPASQGKVVKAEDVSNDEAFLTLYYNLPDAETVKKCAAAGDLQISKDGTYYDFPLEIDTEGENSKEGKLFAWAGTGGVRYNEQLTEGENLLNT